MTSVVQALEPELVWVDGAFRPNLAVLVDGRGMIVGVEPAGSERYGHVRSRLAGRALVPGLVNAHSHAFQRLLRGRAERFGAQEGSFWTWRDTMYELAGALDGPSLFDACVAAFNEMRDGGITTVGEFHYLHHVRAGDYALDEWVLQAARVVGIRLVLLQTAYSSSGFGRPLEPAQRRFDTADMTAYWRSIDRLTDSLGPNQHVGVAGHSVRAVPLGALAELRNESVRRDLIFHMHLEEQSAEIEQCLATHGHTPMRGVLDRLAPLGGLTAVHCTHSRSDELAEFLEAGGRVCVCPTTEANLGDGLPRVPAGAAAGGRIALGTDSNARIAMTEEMRWLELGQRLQAQARGVLTDSHGEVASVLMRCATEAGASALGVPSGAIQRGLAADFALLDLTHPALAMVSPPDLAAAWILGAPDDVVCATAVSGQWRSRLASGVSESSGGPST